MAIRYIRHGEDDVQEPEILSIFPENANFVTPYDPIAFPFGSVLSSRQLNSMQARMQAALQDISMAMSGEIDWVVINFAKNELDAVFSQDTTDVSDHDLNTFYSDRHGAQGATFLPNFPSFTFVSTDILYFGSNFPFVNLAFDFLTPAGGAISITWEYWDTSTGWTAVAGLGDTTTGFSSDGNVSWTDPEDDWEPVDIDSALSLTRFSLDTVERYWVRARTSSTQAPSIVIQEVTIHTPMTKSLKVDPTAPLSQSVIIYPGLAIVNGRVVMVNDFTIMDMTAFEPGSNSVYVAIQLNDQGVISGIASDAAASPKRPEPDQNAIVLAHVLVQSGFANINTPQITDTRIYWDNLSEV